MRVMILASGVGKFGEGATGGVSRYAQIMAKALSAAGIKALFLVPEGSSTPAYMKAEFIPGAFQPSAATTTSKSHILPANSVLSNMMDRAFGRRSCFDRIINLNHDYLPIYSTGYFDGKLRHILNLVTSDLATDHMILHRFGEYPACFATLSRFQKDRLQLADACVLGFGMNRFVGEPITQRSGDLCWAGRITSNKGLEFAAEIARRCKRKLRVAGYIEDQRYFSHILKDYAETIDYRGFIALEPLIKMISSSLGMLQTQTWEEALGLSTIEAIATGTPVVAFDRGANGEVITHGLNGYIVPHGDLSAAADAADRLSLIKRADIDDDFEARFSFAAFQERLVSWLA